MKRIVIGIITIIAALSLAVYTTRAVWSDSVTITGNQIQTGTADLQVSVDSGTNWNTNIVVSTLILNNLVPGGQAYAYAFSLYNASTPGVTFNLTGQITDVSGAGADESQLEIAVYEDGNTPESGSGWISLSGWQTSNQSFNSSLNQGLGNTKNYQIAARLKTTATNDWQGRTVTFTLTVTGQ